VATVIGFRHSLTEFKYVFVALIYLFSGHGVIYYNMN
jgi:hypothetical protein